MEADRDTIITGACQAVRSGLVGVSKAASVAGVHHLTISRRYVELYGVPPPRRQPTDDLERRVLARLLTGRRSTPESIAKTCKTTPNVVRAIATKHASIKRLFKGYKEASDGPTGQRNGLQTRQPRGEGAGRPAPARAPQGASGAVQAL